MVQSQALPTEERWENFERSKIATGLDLVLSSLQRRSHSVTESVRSYQVVRPQVLTIWCDGEDLQRVESLGEPSHSILEGLVD
jgi:hypothetical protein